MQYGWAACEQSAYVCAWAWAWAFLLQSVKPAVGGCPLQMCHAGGFHLVLPQGLIRQSKTNLVPEMEPM